MGRAGASRGEGHGRLLLALGLAAGPLVALGLARFAYALLLPAMRDDLGWSYAEAGALNTTNAAGYLVGALLAAPLARVVGSRRSFLLGTSITTVAIGLTAATSAFAALLTIRFVAGLAGALAFIIGAALVAEASHRGSRGRAALLLGIYFGGSGTGIVLAGLLVPWVLDLTDGTGWRQGWLGLAADRRPGHHRGHRGRTARGRPSPSRGPRPPLEPPADQLAGGRLHLLRHGLHRLPDLHQPVTSPTTASWDRSSPASGPLSGLPRPRPGHSGGQSSAASAAPAGRRSSWWCLPPARCCQSCSVAR